MTKQQAKQLRALLLRARGGLDCHCEQGCRDYRSSCRGREDTIAEIDAYLASMGGTWRERRGGP